MKTIYKYELKITPKQEITIQKGYKNLRVGYDGRNKLCLWSMVDDQASKTKCVIYIVGTGNEMSDSKVEYLGSVNDNMTNINLTFIWHIFSEKRIG
jgi:hypothetical protein